MYGTQPSGQPSAHTCALALTFIHNGSVRLTANVVQDASARLSAIRYPLCTSADRLSAAAHQLISFSSHLFIIGQQQAASGAVSVHFGGWCMRTVRFTVLLLALMVDGRRDSPHTCLSYGQRLHDAVLVVGTSQHTICHCLDLVHRVRHGAAHARQLQHLNVVLTVARSHDV